MDEIEFRGPTAACLIVLCGLPFTGKTTIAQKIATQLGYARVEIDQINTSRGVGLNAAPIQAFEWNVTYAESFRQVDQHLAHGRSVIYDATNFTRPQREAVREIATRHEIPSVILYVDAGVAEARRRWADNRQTGERYDVRDSDFDLVVHNFEIPDGEEGNIIRYDGLQPLADLISRLMDTLRCDDSRRAS